MEIREATTGDDDLFVRHYLEGWATENWPEEQYYPDAAARVRRFIQSKREGDGVGGFVAMDGKEVAGTVGYHLDFDPYPRVIQPAYLFLAYVWILFVEPSYRRQGLAKRLMAQVTEHLRAAGCNGIVLHHATEVRGFYEQLGYEPATELRLALVRPTEPLNQPWLDKFYGHGKRTGK